MKRISDFFDQCCELYGDSGWEAAAWSSRKVQQDMFYVLSRVGISGSVLDVGCGQGDYYSFLRGHYPKTEYTGIDISKKMIEISQDKYPLAKFQLVDLADYHEHHDWVVGAGPFNFKIGNDETQRNYIHKQIQKMYELANKGVSLSFLANKMAKEKFEELHYYDPVEIVDFCFGVTNRVVLDHATLSSQFVVYLLR